MEGSSDSGWFRRPRAIQAEGGESGNDLDPEIWSRLPYEFLRLILERVPTDALMRWRRVSKRWVHNFLLIATSSSLWLPPVGETIPVYHVPIEISSKYFHDEAAVSLVLSTFNKSQYTWYDLILPLHESHPGVKKFQGSNLFSTGGLLLLYLSFINLNHTPDNSITVFNPTTRMVRQLPPPPDALARAIGIIKSCDTRSYAVIASRRAANEQGSRLFMYKSENKEWLYCGNSSEEIRPTASDSAVSIGSLLYFLLENDTLSTPKKKVYRMFSFDVITQTCQDWGEVPKHYGAGKPALMEIGGIIFYVARKMWSQKQQHFLTWMFYKLDPESPDWDEAKSMPMGVYSQLIERIDNRGLEVTGAGNFIYFYGMPRTLVGTHLVLTHNYSDDTWYWIPHVSTTVGNISVKLRQSVVISLEPSLMPV